MKNKEPKAMERAATKRGKTRYVLRLYIAGAAPRSTEAVFNIRKICEEYLRDRYDLAIADADVQMQDLIDALSAYSQAMERI